MNHLYPISCPLPLTDLSWGSSCWLWQQRSCWWETPTQTESCQGEPRGSSPVRSTLVASGTRLAPTAKGEETAAQAGMTCAQCLIWTPSVTVTCSATAPSLTAAPTSGVTVWMSHHLSLVSKVWVSVCDNIQTPHWTVSSTLVTVQAYLRAKRGTVGFLLIQTEGGTIGGQEQECGLCRGRERQTGTGQEVEGSMQVCVPWATRQGPTHKLLHVSVST